MIPWRLSRNDAAQYPQMLQAMLYAANAQDIPVIQSARGFSVYLKTAFHHSLFLEQVIVTYKALQTL